MTDINKQFENLPPPKTKMQKYMINTKKLNSFEHQLEVGLEQPFITNESVTRRIFVKRQIGNLRAKIKQYEEVKTSNFTQFKI